MGTKAASYGPDDSELAAAGANPTGPHAAGCLLFWDDTPRICASCAVYGSCLAFGAGMGLLGAAVPQLSELLQRDEAEVGGLFAFRGAGFLLGTLLTGAVIDIEQHVVSKHLMCVLSILMSAVATWLVPLTASPSDSALLALRLLFLLQGIGYGGVDSLSIVAISDMWGQRVQPWIQAKSLMSGLGGIIAPMFLGSFGLTSSFHFAASTMFLAVAGLIAEATVTLLCFKANSPHSLNSLNITELTSAEFTAGNRVQEEDPLQANELKALNKQLEAFCEADSDSIQMQQLPQSIDLERLSSCSSFSQDNCGGSLYSGSSSSINCEDSALSSALQQCKVGSSSSNNVSPKRRQLAELQRQRYFATSAAGADEHQRLLIDKRRNVNSSSSLPNNLNHGNIHSNINSLYGSEHVVNDLEMTAMDEASIVNNISAIEGPLQLELDAWITPLRSNEQSTSEAAATTASQAAGTITTAANAAAPAVTSRPTVAADAAVVNKSCLSLVPPNDTSQHGSDSSFLTVTPTTGAAITSVTTANAAATTASVGTMRHRNKSSNRQHRELVLAYASPRIVRIVEKRTDTGIELTPVVACAVLFNFVCWYIGLLITCGGWISAYVLQRGVALNYKDGAFFTTLFYISSTVGSLLSIPAAVFLSTTALLRLELSLLTAGSLLFVFSGRSYWLTFAAISSIGFSLSCVYPLIMTVSNDYGFTMDGRRTIALVLGGNIGESAMPTVIGFLMQRLGTESFPIATLAISILMLSSYAAVHWMLSDRENRLLQKENERVALRCVQQQQQQQQSYGSIPISGYFSPGAASWTQQPLSNNSNNRSGLIRTTAAAALSPVQKILLGSSTSRAPPGNRSYSAAQHPYNRLVPLNDRYSRDGSSRSSPRTAAIPQPPLSRQQSDSSGIAKSAECSSYGSDGIAGLALAAM